MGERNEPLESNEKKLGASREGKFSRSFPFPANELDWRPFPTPLGLRVGSLIRSSSLAAGIHTSCMFAGRNSRFALKWDCKGGRTARER